MFKREGFWGWTVTVVYLYLWLWMVIARRQELIDLKLNELGDFLAGSFGPIAFFWLILGFIQQGRELKLSSDALHLQAEELKRSVEQQSIMAAAATQQFETQLKALNMQQSEYERSISPIFRFQSETRGGLIPGMVEVGISFHNSGEEASKINCSFDPPIGQTDLVSLDRLAKERSYPMKFVFARPENLVEGICSLMYTRLDAKVIKESYIYKIDPLNPFIIFDKAANLS